MKREKRTTGNEKREGQTIFQSVPFLGSQFKKNTSTSPREPQLAGSSKSDSQPWTLHPGKLQLETARATEL